MLVPFITEKGEASPHPSILSASILSNKLVFLAVVPRLMVKGNRLWTVKG
ncbi:hypothetical protein CWATWH0402_3433 [Crocosphaera watsonii WH 0402]|uniref:Uncharacterized protein n=1 Tax=Crocosphaera watsonii WH 0402 TaxID=1284629 RepID=T2JPE0_CROWT|nr:hypothetical protein CWATWH0402_3433 [Crocosphaera watsonii WH 0402]